MTHDSSNPILDFLTFAIILPIAKTQTSGLRLELILAGTGEMAKKDGADRRMRMG